MNSVGDVGGGEPGHVWGEGIRERPILSSQFGCEPKTALKSKAHLKKNGNSFNKKHI